MGWKPYIHMPRKHYDWENPPELEAHSKVKHEILRDYIVEYIKVYGKNPHVPKLPMYFIDGFAGGGKYWFQRPSQIVSGSPFIMMEACVEGETYVNKERTTNPFQVFGQYFFIDKDKDAHYGLRKNIENSHFAPWLNQGRIQLIKSTFNQAIETIIQRIETANPKARALFLLDQYGYNQISVGMINKILSRLPFSEIILNFNVDSLINYISEKNIDSFIEKTQFSLDHLRGRVEQLWEKGDEDNRRQILQKYFYEAITRDCGAGYYESFFIKNPHGYGLYWLIHMSRQPTARHVMNEIGWRYGNEVVQYAGEGLDRFNMMGYSPLHDDRFMAGELEIFSFQPAYHQMTLERLSEQIPRMLHGRFSNGVKVEEFLNATCNHTGASKAQYLTTLTSLHAGNEITLMDENGRVLRRGSKAKEKLVLLATNQPKLFL
ncbi:three-Cys-motif partner protein TcmP [Chromobacterium sp. LK1]|uniref:three-Cys-motif partner protein TcmP n=1 Tax=Chromobacterium sp. LK1 TaxID=1628193 RepID=UPI000A74A545|nr:three-Cys-motif partner protein TcmP [Chromobacterium sp. LK1]